jgi:ABC-2 type transport system permease protein
LIFFGLLGLYFANIRRLSYDLSHATWVNMVSFLNLTVVGLILSTFTSRFIFPMISLEGRRFWILGRLPIKRRTILWSKFLFAALGSIVPCLGLVLLSDVMLGVQLFIVALHALTCIMLCVGLSALSVGMGAKMPNLREDSPSKIAAGFGGTLNLVVSTIYILAIVLLTALPCHFYLGAQQADPGGLVFNQTYMLQWMLAGAVASLVLCVVATVIPLRIGIQAFDRLEF